MSVTSLVCRELDRVAAPCTPFTIRPFTQNEDHTAMVLLAAVFDAAEGGPAPRPDGMMAELQSRRGRAVNCWLAWPRPAVDITPVAMPSGLVTLVESHDRAGRVRWSIGWLLVHPGARRQGLGRGLVAVAVRHARDAGADMVWAETAAAWPAARFWQAVGFQEARRDG